MSRIAAKSPPQTAYELIKILLQAAMNFTPRERGEATFRKYLPQRDRDLQEIPEQRRLAMSADAVLLTADLLLSQPSASGANAFDRLARSPAAATPSMAAAATALCQARFRLLRLQEGAASGGTAMRDVISDDLLCIAAPELPRLPANTILFGRVAPLGEGGFCFAGAITPLDAAALAVARHHPAAGAQAPAAAARWVEAVYAHVVRNGTLDLPGLNRPADYGNDDIFEPGDDQLVDLTLAWLALGPDAPDAALLQRTRQSADVPTVVDACAAAVLARDAGREDMASAIERLVLVQMETLRQRERGGAGVAGLDAVGQAIDRNMATLSWPRRVRTLFETLRAQLGGGRGTSDPSLERLVQRIQALRAKTVAQGCTEHEALAAAEKVAELLDRHGLSLGELEFRAQPCEGIGIETDRRRMAPIDHCVPAIAAFFDCRVWAERSQTAPLRYIFFGLRGDVTAAQYVYEMVERAFEIETAAFHASDLYFAMAGERRSATNSFQTGLAHGISDKLHAMRAARDSIIRSASGRDLVPVKAAMVDEEMAKLGLSLTRRAVGRGKRVITDAFAVGEAAGQRFEVSPAITKAA